MTLPQRLGMRGAVVIVFLAVSLAGMSARQASSGAVSIDNDDLGGVVSGPRGPEAGVWVIAETRDLPTGFRRIVVTDDRGRYLVPDLPKGNYSVWVRGYGLVDSQKVMAAPGKTLNLTAVTAPDARSAAQYYPAGYWFSLLRAPAKSEFPGTGPTGNGIAPNLKSQGEFLRILKTDGCWACHQLGNQATREIPPAFRTLGSSAAAWERRVQSGQAGNQMLGDLNNMGAPRALAMFADWTDRIAGGELPTQPPRPQGVERNVVITQWDWADPKTYLHDALSTDKRNPTVNPNGAIYGGLEASADYLPVVEPARNAASQVKTRVLDPNAPRPGPPRMPSVYWGEEVIWDSQSTVHSLAMDKQGRVWTASRATAPATPAFCRPGSSHPSAVAFPIETRGLSTGVYDPKTKQFTPINTCFGTHHLNFANDADNTLWFCGGGQVVGWFNTKVYDETKNAEKAQGWTVLVLDTNGNGKRDAYVEPDQPVDPNAWVDRFDTFGLGRNVPFATGNGSGGMVAVADGQVRTFRVPYPLGFYGKGADGRIDDPNAGWKGKGMYTTYATRAPFHSEGGKGTTSKVVKFQLRPDPLAK